MFACDGRVANGAAVVVSGRQGNGSGAEPSSSSSDRISINSLSAESPSCGNESERVIIKAALLGGGRRGASAIALLVVPILIVVAGGELRLLLLTNRSDP